MPFEQTRDLAVFIIGGIIVCIDILVVLFFSVTPTAPMWLSLTLTGVLGVIIVVSYVKATRAYLLKPVHGDSVQQHQSRQPIADVIVSVTVLGPMTIIVGTIGGAILTVLARAGGPDLSFGEDTPLRKQLLQWRKRNRTFLQTKGQGELPLRLD